MTQIPKIRFFSYPINSAFFNDRQGKLNELSDEVNKFLIKITPENLINTQFIIMNGIRIVVMVVYKE